MAQHLCIFSLSLFSFPLFSSFFSSSLLPSLPLFVSSLCSSLYFFLICESCSFQFSSVTQSCPTFWDPMDCSTPDFTVHHQLQELMQIHVWSWLCNPMISPSVIPFSTCLHLSQHQDLFQWVSFSYQVANVLQFQLQHQSFQWIFRTDFPQDWLT